MNTRLAASVACVAVLLVASAVIPEAQRRGGAPPGAGGPGRGGRGGVGTVERIVVPGTSLEGNLEGDPVDRAVTVYLPPSYAADQTRRYAVVYLLHGMGQDENAFLEAGLQQSADRLAAAQGFSQFIVVTPNAFTLHGGSMYATSVTIGDWERFIAEDLVAAIDSRYRTLTHRMSRGIAGFSMGGYGAFRIGMRRPDVFANLYSLSACCVAPVSLPVELLTAAETVTTRERAETTPRSVVHGMAAAWSPNPGNPPLFVDLPTRNGKVRPDIVAKWNDGSLLAMVGAYASNLDLYFAIAMDVGTADPLLEQHRQFAAQLRKLRLPHTFEEYEGDHGNRLRERLERNLLPFFARNLAAPTNLTSPSPPADRFAR